MDEKKKNMMELKYIIIGIVISSLLAAFLYFSELLDIPFYIPYAVLFILVGLYYLVDAIKEMIRIKNE